MSRQAPVRDVVPAVQKLRIHYAKRGRLRFSSHRDFQRALERALRRCQIPMAYSQGFSPHPKISFANAVPTGVASEAEYVEIQVTALCDPVKVAQALNDSLPEGLDVVEVVEAHTADFIDRLQASLWRVELPDVSADQAASAISALLAADEVQVTRKTKNGLRTFDARGAIVSLESDSGDLGAEWTMSGSGCAILKAVTRHVTPSVRPDDLLSALRIVADLEPPTPPRVTRLAQGPLNLESASVDDPFVDDRAV